MLKKVSFFLFFSVLISISFIFLSKSYAAAQRPTVSCDSCTCDSDALVTAQFSVDTKGLNIIDYKLEGKIVGETGWIDMTDDCPYRADCNPTNVSDCCYTFSGNTYTVKYKGESGKTYQVRAKIKTSVGWSSWATCSQAICAQRPTVSCDSCTCDSDALVTAQFSVDTKGLNIIDYKLEGKIVGETGWIDMTDDCPYRADCNPTNVSDCCYTFSGNTYTVKYKGESGKTYQVRAKIKTSAGWSSWGTCSRTTCEEQGIWTEWITCLPADCHEECSYRECVGDICQTKIGRYPCPGNSCTTNADCTSCDCDPWVDQSCGGNNCSDNQMYQTRSCHPSGCAGEERCISDPSCTSCDCDPWVDQSCGGNNCSDNQMYQTRSCHPSGCAGEERCISDPSCTSSPPTPTCDIQFSPSTVETGESSTLIWSSENCNSADLDCQGAGESFSDSSCSGTHIFTPSEAGTLSCTFQPSGPGGNNNCSADLTVNVPAPEIELNLEPEKIKIGQSATISWTTENCSSCTASSDPEDEHWKGSKPLSGSQNLSPKKTTTYTLTCSGNGQTASESVTLEIYRIPWWEILASKLLNIFSWR